MPLFNRDNNGSTELFQMTGTFQASTRYEAIANDIDDATEELRSIIGEVVASAEQDYAESKDSTTLHLVQRVVAAGALCFFAKKTGLSHGGTGRKMKVDENEKIPFEWMIDRDDQELKERHYRALDRLLSHLESEGSEEWKKSPAFTTRTQLQVKTLAQFETVYPISGSSYTFYCLTPLMLEAQNTLLKKLALAKASDLPDIPDTTKCIVLSALATALERWSLNIFPLEISRRFAPSYQGNKETASATATEIAHTRRVFLREAADAAVSIYRTVHKNNPTPDTPVMPKNDKQNKFFTA